MGITSASTFAGLFFSNVFRNKNILWPPDFQNRNGDFSSNFSFLQKISSQEFWNTNFELKGDERKKLDFDDGLTGDEQLYQHSRKARTFLIT